MTQANKIRLDLILIFLFPIGIVVGPAVAEIFILFFLIYILNIHKKLFDYLGENIIKSVIIFFSLIIIFSLINYFLSNFENLNSLLKGISYSRFLIIIFFFLLFLVDDKRLKFFFQSLCCVILFLVIDINIQNYFGNDLFGFPKSANGRLSGPFNDEFIVGGVVFKFLVMLNICFEIIFKKKTNSKFFLLTILNLICFVSILLSKERSTIILSSFYIIWIYFFSKNINLKYKLAFFSIIGIILITFISFDKNLSKRFNESYVLIKNLTLNKNSNNVIGYYSHFYAALEIFKDNKILGSGIKRYKFDCKQYQNIDTHLKNKFTKNLNEIQKLTFNKNICTTHPHYYLLEILAETGFIIFLFYLFLIFYLLSKSFTTFFPIIFTIFIPIVPTGSFFNNFNSFFIWIVFSLLLIYLRKKNEKS